MTLNVGMTSNIQTTSKRPNQTKSMKPNQLNQTYQNKTTKLNLPNQTYQIKPNKLKETFQNTKIIFMIKNKLGLSLAHQPQIVIIQKCF